MDNYPAYDIAWRDFKELLDWKYGRTLRILRFTATMALIALILALLFWHQLIDVDANLPVVSI